MDERKNPSGRAAESLDWPDMTAQIKGLKFVEVPDRELGKVARLPGRLQSLVLQELRHLDKAMRMRPRTLGWKRPKSETGTESVTRTVGDTNSQRDDGSAQVDISYTATPGPVVMARVENISAWRSLGGTSLLSGFDLARRSGQWSSASPGNPKGRR